MDPPYHIPLDSDTLALIGEICAIQGQVEWSMQNTVRELLRIDIPLALRLMGSTSIGTNACIWIDVVRSKERRSTILREAEKAFAAISSLSEGRNDFIHALFMVSNQRTPEDYFIPLDPKPEMVGFYAQRAVALRVRNRKAKPVSEIKKIRDLAAITSLRVAHVHLRSALKTTSPWQHILDLQHRLESPKVAAKKGKARPSQPQPSPRKPQ